MNCDAIIDTMTDYLLGKLLGNNVEKPDEELVHHCATCPTCTEKMDIIVRIMTGKDYHLSRPLHCEDVLDRIPEMVDYGEDVLAGRYPAEWLHMQTCDKCHEVFKMTASCMTKEYEAAFEKVRKSVTTTSGGSEIVWESIGPQVHKLSRQLNILISRGKEALSLVPEWLATASMLPAPSMVHRGTTSEGKYFFELAIPCPQQNRQVVVRISAETPENIQLRLQLKDSNSNDAISGVVMALLDSKGRFLTQLFTPESSHGESWAEFNDIHPGNYTLRITEDQTRWEVPLHLG